jgi:hypothetical protein
MDGTDCFLLGQFRVSFAAGYCTLDNVPSGIPLESQDSHGSLDCPGHLQDFDGEPPKEHGESTVGFGPRYCNRLDSMHWALDPRDSGH